MAKKAQLSSDDFFLHSQVFEAFAGRAVIRVSQNSEKFAKTQVKSPKTQVSESMFRKTAQKKG